MNKLPKETFLLVTEYLDFDTRFQLSLVCKQWHSVISSHNLYETVYIEKEHEEIINFFNNKKLYGKTVKSLQVNGIGINFSILKDWPHYFPNIQNLSLSISEIDMFASDFEEELEEEEEEQEEEEEEQEEEESDCFYKSHTSFLQWNRLSSISEFTKYMYTSSILISGYYPNLTTMDLNFNIIPFHTSNTVMDNLINSIKNAPNLKYLKLIVAQLTLKKLNLLHQNSPNIEGLILEDISLGQDNDNEELVATTTTKLKRLEMQGSRYSFYENEQLSIHDWLDYISKSYQEIQVIKMNQFTPANIEYEDDIINVVNHCQLLTTFNVDFCHFSTRVLQTFDNNTSIKLEKYSSQSQDLTELRNLSCSNQRHSIYRLDLVVPIGNTDLIEILNQFTGLTTINTYPSSDIDYTLDRQLQVPINTFLNHHTLLEFLSLSSCHIYVDKNDNSKVNSVLDTLEMEKVTIVDKDVFKFISTSCLQLKVTILTAKFLQKQALDTPTLLNFENHIIVYLKIYIEGHAFIELQEYLKSTIKYYQVEKEGKKIMYTQKEKVSDKRNKGFLVIQAKQVERFVVNLPRDPFQTI